MELIFNALCDDTLTCGFSSKHISNNDEAQSDIIQTSHLSADVMELLNVPPLHFDEYIMA